MPQYDQGKSRCFGDGDPLMAAYHDQEWGVPVRRGVDLFAHLTLDIFQAGLSWRVILHKREALLAAFDGLDPHRIQIYGEEEIERLLGDEGIVRNRAKIEATINNARAYCEMEDGGADFAEYLWQFTGGEIIKGPRARRFEDLPSASPESEAMAESLKQQGFKFVGPTICYAFMQAVGMVDDHLVDCFKYSGRP